jgi:hypothetical protein
MEAPRDDSQITAKLGVTAGGVTVPWLIDHTTGYLGFSVIDGTLNTPVYEPVNAPRDDNRCTVLMGVDSTGARKPVSIDNATGRVKVIFS